jgi:flagellar FliJ protein
MRRYKFKLQRVLDFKETKEWLAQESLAEATREHISAQDALAEMEEHKAKLLSDIGEAEDGSVDLRQLELCLDYLDFLLERIENKTEEVAGLAEVVEERRAELIEASREKETIVKVKERDFGKYVTLMRALEQKLIDDLATTKAAREISSES